MGKVLKYKPNSNSPNNTCWVEKLSSKELQDNEVIDMAISCDEFVFSRFDESSEDYFNLKNADFNTLKNIETLHKALPNGDLEEIQLSFNKQTDKNQFMNLITNFLQTGSALRRVREDLVLCADELFTNFKKSALSEKEMVLKIQFDEKTVLMTCEDTFGTLKPKVMLENIKRCFAKGIKNAIRKEATGGAGIGSFLMYKISLGMAIIVEENVSTKIAVWMPRLEHHEDRVDKNKEIFISFKRGA